MQRVEAVEYTDAVCSTAWGAEPLLRRLDWRHGHHIAWRKVMGGLVGDASRGKEAWDRVSAAEPMRAYWKRVWLLTGMPFPNPMHLMLRSTDPLGAAVKAAERQGQAGGDAGLRRVPGADFRFWPGPPDARRVRGGVRGRAGAGRGALARRPGAAGGRRRLQGRLAGDPRAERLGAQSEARGPDERGAEALRGPRPLCAADGDLPRPGRRA